MLLVAQYEVGAPRLQPATTSGTRCCWLARWRSIGGRLYHVIDQWDRSTAQDPLWRSCRHTPALGCTAVLPGPIWASSSTRAGRRSAALSASTSSLPARLFAQGIARWGNFFNQELYGPPTDLPWGIAIDCAHRVAEWPCSLYPRSDDRLPSALLLRVGARHPGRLRRAVHLAPLPAPSCSLATSPPFWGIWYGSDTSLPGDLPRRLELDFQWHPNGPDHRHRADIVGIIWIIYNHRRGKEPYPYPGADQATPPPARSRSPKTKTRASRTTSPMRTRRAMRPRTMKTRSRELSGRRSRSRGRRRGRRPQDPPSRPSA